jgi:hypothetical protein
MQARREIKGFVIIVPVSCEHADNFIYMYVYEKHFTGMQPYCIIHPQIKVKYNDTYIYPYGWIQ